jgi:hypothetical protein
MENFKIVIKTIKPKMKETDPDKIEAKKEKRRQQREARKNQPKEPKEEKKKTNNTEEIENLNKSLKNLIGYSIDEINDKIKSLKVSPVQLGPEPAIIEEVVKEKKKRKIKSNV